MNPEMKQRLIVLALNLPPLPSSQLTPPQGMPSVIPREPPPSAAKRPTVPDLPVAPVPPPPPFPAPVPLSRPVKVTHRRGLVIALVLIVLAVLVTVLIARYGSAINANASRPAAATYQVRPLPVLVRLGCRPGEELAVRLSTRP